MHDDQKTCAQSPKARKPLNFDPQVSGQGFKVPGSERIPPPSPPQKKIKNENRTSSPLKKPKGVPPMPQEMRCQLQEFLSVRAEGWLGFRV